MSTVATGAADVHNDPGNDLDGFSALSCRLRAIQWPATFKPTGIEKYDGE